MAVAMVAAVEAAMVTMSPMVRMAMAPHHPHRRVALQRLRLMQKQRSRAIALQQQRFWRRCLRWMQIILEVHC